jgi:hypothetical protein
VKEYKFLKVYPYQLNPRKTIVPVVGGMYPVNECDVIAFANQGIIELPSMELPVSKSIPKAPKDKSITGDKNK